MTSHGLPTSVSDYTVMQFWYMCLCRLTRNVWKKLQFGVPQVGRSCQQLLPVMLLSAHYCCALAALNLYFSIFQALIIHVLAILILFILEKVCLIDMENVLFTHLEITKVSSFTAVFICITRNKAPVGIDQCILKFPKSSSVLEYFLLYVSNNKLH